MIQFNKNFDVTYGRYDTKNTDENLSIDVNNIIKKVYEDAASNIEVIYVITWRNLKLDLLKTEVLSQSF